MYPQKFLTTERLTTAYYRAGREDAPKLLLIHGNLSSSVFLLPLFPALTQWFDVAAPDLRCFGDTENLPVDATRGYRDWSDDLFSFVDALGWDRFSILGWSMGGNIAMQCTLDHSERIEKLILVAPGSPYGFGGTKDEEGTPQEPLGLGSGGGCVNPMLMMAGHNKTILHYILNHLYFKPPFRMSEEWEDLLVDGISKTKMGDGRYPGSSHYTFRWPFVVAGDKGVLNAMSSKYGSLTHITELERKPPILWVRGDSDILVSDGSLFEVGYLGSIGLFPGWPGKTQYPPQPMVSQTRYILKQYQQNGGTYQELVLPGGHMCCLESPQPFLAALYTFLVEDQTSNPASCDSTVKTNPKSATA